jgi:hypothetical protein
MRTFNLGSTEDVEGLITDLRHNDLTVVKNTIQLAVTPEDVDEHPTTGWVLRSTVSMVGPYTVIAGRSYTATALGLFKLWGHWVNGTEDVYIMIGKFRVI